MNFREECLRKACECVNGARENDYGTPEDNFGVIADLWTTYLDYEITKQDVANMMILLKIARIKTGTGTDDCYVDIAGYSACGYELNNRLDDKIQDEKAPWMLAVEKSVKKWKTSGRYPWGSRIKDDYLIEDQFFDPKSGRHFKSTLGKIQSAIAVLNNNLVSYGFASINDFYREIGLAPISKESGWDDLDHEKVDISVSREREGDTVVWVIHFNNLDYEY